MKKIDKFLMTVFIYIFTSFVAYGYRQEITVKVTPLDSNIKMYSKGSEKTIFDLGFFNSKDVNTAKKFDIAEVEVRIDIVGDPDSSTDERYDILGIEVEKNGDIENQKLSFVTTPTQFTNKNNINGTLTIRPKNFELLQRDGKISGAYIVFKYTGSDDGDYASKYYYKFILEAEVDIQGEGAMFGFSPYKDKVETSIGIKDIIREQVGNYNR